MTGIVATVQDSVNSSCLAKILRKDGCQVSLVNVPKKRVIVDFDKPGSPIPINQTRCDYLFAAEEKNRNLGWIILLELKGRGFRAAGVVRQLQEGAKCAESIVLSSQTFKFRPSVACKSVHKAVRAKLKLESNKIKLHTHSEFIRIIKCGDQLLSLV